MSTKNGKVKDAIVRVKGDRMVCKPDRLILLHIIVKIFYMHPLKHGRKISEMLMKQIIRPE